MAEPPNPSPIASLQGGENLLACVSFPVFKEFVSGDFYGIITTIPDWKPIKIGSLNDP
ncbi:MAG: hypothetical protein WCW25_01210 [Patescibacteria group bacterium]